MISPREALVIIHCDNCTHMRLDLIFVSGWWICPPCYNRLYGPNDGTVR